MTQPGRGMAGVTAALRRQVEQMMTMDQRLNTLEHGGVGTKGAKGETGDGIQVRVLGQWLQLRVIPGDGAPAAWVNLFNLAQLIGPEGPQASAEDITAAANAYLQDNPAAVTEDQVLAALAAYLEEHPLPAGPPGPPGPPPTEEELREHVDAQVTAYLEANPPAAGPTGPDGPGPGDAQVMGAVSAYLSAHPTPPGPRGEQGEEGPPGATPDADAIAAAVSSHLTQHPVAPGPQGSEGAQGPPGPVPELTIGTVTTLAAGVAATASITGTATHPVLNLGIPRGATGSTGSTGSTGPAGFLDGKSIALPGVAHLVAGTVREYTVTWNYALPNANYSVTFLPDQVALGANFTFAVKTGTKTTTQFVVQVTNNSTLTVGAAAVHVIARSA